MEELLAYTLSHVCLLRFLLALNFVAVSFYLSDLLLNNYWATYIEYQYLFNQAVYYPTRKS